MYKKPFSLIGSLLLLAGLVLLGYSLFLSPYSDSVAYYAQYGSIDLSASDAMQRFSGLRDTFLTSKFSMHDYGITIGLAGLLLLLTGIVGVERFRTPAGRRGIFLIGVLAVLLSGVALSERLHLSMLRGAFPHWADSLGIASAAILALCVLLFLWVLLLLLLFRGSYAPRVPIFPIEVQPSDWFLLTIVAITSLLIVAVMLLGHYGLVIPGLLWGYFYLSILRGRRLAQRQML